MKMLIRAIMIAVCMLGPMRCVAADEPRKIDFTTVLLDQDDKPIVAIECANATTDAECKDKKQTIFTLGLVALRSLNLAEANLQPGESQRRGYLAVSIYKSAGAQLSSDEITLIKNQIAKMYAPIVVMRAFEILDPIPKK